MTKHFVSPSSPPDEALVHLASAALLVPLVELRPTATSQVLGN